MLWKGRRRVYTVPVQYVKTSVAVPELSLVFGSGRWSVLKGSTRFINSQ